MIQDPNPTDYPHLEDFIDWLYKHVEELPADAETLKAFVRAGLAREAKRKTDAEWLKQWHKKHRAPITKGKPL